MKSIKAAVILAAILAVVPCVAQNRSTFGGAADAYDFAFGQNPGSPALLVTQGCSASGACTLTLAYGQTTTASGVPFTPVSTNIPIAIGEGSNYEVVTPSSVSCSTPAVQYTCQLTATFSGVHGAGSYVRSGDFGLQEAATYVVAQGGGLVLLSPKWFAAEGGHSAGVTALTGAKSLATSTYTVLDYSGIAGAVSYAAASGSNYASTTHVIY